MNDTQYVHKLGMSSEWKFIDVYDLSTDGLQSVPRPVAAALCLFPVSLSPQVGTCRMGSSSGDVVTFEWHFLFILCDVCVAVCDVACCLVLSDSVIIYVMPNCAVFTICNY